jgi:carbon storage regulator
MLALSRRIGERIVVGGRIEIVVVEIKGNKVRLAFEAPDDVHIRRNEIRFDVADRSTSESSAATY